MELKSSFDPIDGVRMIIGGSKRTTHRSDWCFDSPVKSSKTFFCETGHTSYAFVRSNQLWPQRIRANQAYAQQVFTLFPFVLDKRKKKKERGKKEHSILHSIYRRNFEIRRCVWTARGPRIKGSGRCAEADAANASPPLANLVSPRLENRTRAIPAMISRRGTGLKPCSQSRAHPASDRACSILLRIRVRKLFSAISRLENVWRFFFLSSEETQEEEKKEGIY